MHLGPNIRGGSQSFFGQYLLVFNFKKNFMRLFGIYSFLFWSVVLLSTACTDTLKEDLSLTHREYLSLGVPDNKKIWTQEDYIDAFIALNKLKLTKPSSLPRKNSKKSGVFFDRMISDENFSFLKVDTVSLSEKAYQIQYYSSIQNELITLYTNVLTKDQYYYRELIELYIFGLNVTQKKLDLADKIMRSDETADKNLQYGLYSVQLGYLEMVLYILENHNLSTSYTEKDHARLSKGVIESVKNNKDWMKPNDVEKLKEKFQMAINNTPSKIAMKNYSELIETW